MVMIFGEVRRSTRGVPAAALLVLVAMVLSACSGSAASPAPSATPVVATPAATPAPTAAASPAASGDLILATTTSTQDSGLLDVLVPAFEAATACKVKTVAVGSGAALKLGEEGNADVLMVHSPAAEKTFMEGDYGVNRQLLMHNTFEIVGPPADPAGIKGMTSAKDAFTKIADAKSAFVSRGDASGTEAKELAIWKAAGITPDPAWYIKSGQGMGPTLQIASEKKGYTLTDNATWLAMKANLDLAPMVDSGDPSLLNIYHVIQVNPDKWPKVNAACATAFSEYVLSPEGQKLIGDYGVDKYGQQLFVPDAGKDETTLTAP
jgi:tungstate transport system substrate-binding protein